MLGAIIGDIVGAGYEFNNYRAKDFTPFFHPKAFFTDEPAYTIAVADVLFCRKDLAATLLEWGRRYWNRQLGTSSAPIILSVDTPYSIIYDYGT